MKAPIPATKLLFSILLISAFLAISAIDEGSFLQCLSENSSKLHPISDAFYPRDHSNFTSVLNAYIRNLMFYNNSTPKPVAIVAAKHYSHVQATVICAKKLGLQIRIRSGGHDYDGLSYVSNIPFMLLDMSNLNSIHINLENETALVEAGASLGELYYWIANKSNVHAFPAGVCTTLGLGGHFSGGGYGNMMRKYGLSVDNIVDANIVDVNGRILNRRSMGEDLFWAIRGGGGASFGVILSWKIKLVSVPENVTIFRVDKTLEEGATELIWKWQNIAADKLVRDLFIRLNIRAVNRTQGGEKTIKVAFVGMYLGNLEDLRHLMNTSFPELGLQDKDCFEIRWIESVLIWAGFPKGCPVEVLLNRFGSPLSFMERKSDYVKEPISITGLKSIWKVVAQLGDVEMQWNPYGGKMSEISAAATPFPHRAGNLFKIQYLADWHQPGEEIGNLHIYSTRKLFEAMTPYVSRCPREAFLNYRDIDIGSIGSNGTGSFQEASSYGYRYFGHNFYELVRVKTAVDPENFFRYEQSIPTGNLTERAGKMLKH